MSEGKTPKLRFKEFEGEWTVWRIEDVFSISAGGDIEISKCSPTKTETSPYPVYANSLEKNGLYGYTDSYKIDGESITVVGRGVNIGVSLARYEKYYPIVRLLVLQPRMSANVKFFEEVINRTHIFVESTGVPQLTVPQISTVKISIPLFNEQEKIAEFLSTIDEKIYLQSQKIEGIEKVKRGFMQKIFSRELRFKDDDGEEFGEWDEKLLGEICIVNMGQSPSSEKYNDDGEGLPLIQGNADLKNGKTAPQRYTREITKICEIGNIIMSVRAPVGELGRIVHRACIGRGVCELRPWKCNVGYVYQYLQANMKYWRKIEQGSTFTAVSGDDIRKYRINLPSMAEQNKIADFLSTFDEKIQIEKQILEKWQAVKKGLLQQMFV